MTDIRDSQKDEYWDFLLANDIATEDELRLVTDIIGYSVESLDKILYSKTGLRSVDQYCDEYNIEYPFNESKSVNSITNKILEGKDISAVLSENSTILQDMEISGTDDVDELSTSFINDGDLYRQRTLPVIQNLKKKVAKGTYDPELAVKAFMYVVDDGVRKYDKEFVSGQGKLFIDKKTREEIARELLKHYDEFIHEDVTESVNESVYKVTNIGWDVSPDDVYEDILFNADVEQNGDTALKLRKNIAEALGIDVDTLMELINNDTLYDFLEKKFNDDPNFGVKWMDLPNDCEIPANEIDDPEVDICEWLSDAFNWTVSDGPEYELVED